MILSPSSAIDTVQPSAERRIFRSDAETAIREVVDEWLRNRWPDGRVIHELNMCQGGARIDMMTVTPQHIVGIEIKGPWDTPDRLIGQLAAFRMALPELWLFVAGRMKRETADIAHYLFPSIGIAEILHAGRDADHSGWAEREYRDAWGGAGNSQGVDRRALSVAVIHEATAQPPLDRALLNMLWAEELHAAGLKSRYWSGKAGPRARMIEAMMPAPAPEKMALTCEQLRSRPTQHRADAPATEPAARIG